MCRRIRKLKGYWIFWSDCLSDAFPFEPIAVNQKQYLIKINRAPVLTLWATVVAERLGFTEDEALSLGKAVAGLTAQSKGRRIGIFKPHEENPHKSREKERGEEFWIEVCGRHIPATNTEDGIRAVKGAKPIDPEGVRRYLQNKFADDLDRGRKAMQKLAKAFKPKELSEVAFHLCEKFRPVIPDGVGGWGAKGDLDLGLIASLGKDSDSGKG